MLVAAARAPLPRAPPEVRERPLAATPGRWSLPLYLGRLPIEDDVYNGGVNAGQLVRESTASTSPLRLDNRRRDNDAGWGCTQVASEHGRPPTGVAVQPRPDSVGRCRSHGVKYRPGFHTLSTGLSKGCQKVQAAGWTRDES